MPENLVVGTGLTVLGIVFLAIGAVRLSDSGHTTPDGADVSGKSASPKWGFLAVGILLLVGASIAVAIR